MISAARKLKKLNLYPKAGKLKEKVPAPQTLFITSTDYDKDFNNDAYDWRYRGAYSGSRVNKGWKLALAVKH